MGIQVSRDRLPLSGPPELRQEKSRTSDHQSDEGLRRSEGIFNHLLCRFLGKAHTAIPPGCVSTKYQLKGTENTPGGLPGTLSPAQGL